MIRTDMPYAKKYRTVLGQRIAYVEVGQGDPIIFLHGNGASAYLWRNVLPYVQDQGRCIAPDLVGMGDSEKLPNAGPGSYSFFEQSRYLDALLSELDVTTNVTFVGMDWGAVLAFYWAYRHPEAVKGLAYMETLVQPLTWEQWPELPRLAFQRMRTRAGEQMILQDNVFIEEVIPNMAVLTRRLSEEEVDAYRAPFREPGEGRRPMLTLLRSLPMNGEPADIAVVVQAYSAWLSQSPVAKLFINAEPGGNLTGSQREYCRTWPNQTEVTVAGIHMLTEDAPDQIGTAVAKWHQSI
ncbi:MAG TPA: haloalkane dehalogenase [Ktedonosporobacter sp.]|nr:haloalkane dehalogenase [Ktedonosporobacter sp.]